MNSQARTHRRLVVPSERAMFDAVAARDASYDGVFFYGVVTTGVYCLPSCASRSARRENLRFFPSLEAVRQAGYRPCKLCRPEAANHTAERLLKVARHIEQNAEQRLTLAVLSKIVEMSPSRLQKAFKAMFGASPKAFQDALRVRRLKSALKSGDEVTGAIFSAGYGSTSRVYGKAMNSLGMTPASYRSGGEGEDIHYAYRESALGPLLMAATDRGVCFVQFGDSAETLADRLRAEFPAASIRRSSSEGDAQLDAWVDALDRHLLAESPRPDLPLDLRGTLLQLKVWRFLLSVPEGDVLSYGELADAIGEKKAVRAVASACGRNRVGILVPCHRVLRGNGELGGYRWGLDRKRTLLDLERRGRPDARDADSRT